MGEGDIDGGVRVSPVGKVAKCIGFGLAPDIAWRGEGEKGRRGTKNSKGQKLIVRRQRCLSQAMRKHCRGFVGISSPTKNKRHGVSVRADSRARAAYCPARAIAGVPKTRMICLKAMRVWPLVCVGKSVLTWYGCFASWHQGDSLPAHGRLRSHRTKMG